jgi:putative ABC transport system permease protein
MISDYFRVALINIRHRKLRAWLTVIGIVIGVGAVITLLLVSQGLENAIIEQFNQIGANRIYVFPKTQLVGSFESALTERDQDTVDSVAGVEWTIGYRLTGAEIKFGREKDFSPFIISIQTNGLREKVKDVFFYTPQKGRMFNGGERKAVFIGHNIAFEVFDGDVSIGGNLKINDVKFKVIGVASRLGTPDDNNILIPEEDFIELFPSFNNELSFIEIKVTDGSNVNEVANKIEKRLENKRDDENFSVDTPESFLESLQTVLATIQIVLGGIAAISLVVGGIGIANSMFTSVLERTKEIGIMKAIGARNSEILSIFLAEAAIIGLFGGSIGIVLGISIAYLIKLVASLGGVIINISFQLNIVLFALAFSMIIGIVSGLWPAVQASKQKPIDSLRYE